MKIVQVYTYFAKITEVFKKFNIPLINLNIQWKHL